MDKILIKRGTKEKLEKSSPLSQGELFLAKDEERLYVGGPKGNIPIPTQKDVDEKYQEVATQLAKNEADLKQRGVNVKEFGAVGNANYKNEVDGKWYEDENFTIPATDDSAAFVEALTYFQTANPTTKKLIIPKGNYLIDRDILLDDWDVTIEGQKGARLIAGKNISMAIFVSWSDQRVHKAGTGLRRFIIRNIEFDLDKQNVDGINIDGFTRGCGLFYNRFINIRRNGVVLNSSWVFTVYKNEFEGVRLGPGEYVGTGLRLGDREAGGFYIEPHVHIPVITENSFQYLEKGLVRKGGAGGRIEGNTFEENMQHLELTWVYGGSYNGNYFEKSMGPEGIVFDEARSITFEGNYFSANSEGDHLVLYGLKRSSIKNNYFHDHDESFQIKVPSTVIEGQIIGNEIMVSEGKLDGVIPLRTNTVINPLNSDTEIPKLGSFKSLSNTETANYTTNRHKALIGSLDSQVVGGFSQVIGSSDSAAMHERSGVINSIRTESRKSYTLVGGYGPIEYGRSVSNIKWELHGTTGNLTLAGQVTGNSTFTDFGEYFPNGLGVEIPLGTLVTLNGDKVVPSNPGDDVIGVVSGTAGIVLGDSPFAWQGKYLTGEFGEPLYEWDEEIGDYVRAINPEYNPEQEQIPRSERPDEWTLVGLVGQVYVRIDDSVQVGDYLKSGDGGIGTKSETPTNIKVMKITKPFDGNYGVAYCLLK